MADTSFIFSRYPNMNFQFMLLFKALDEMKQLEPGTRAFRSHLLSMAGLLRYQFDFEEELMSGSRYGATHKHIQDHNRLRRFLAGLLEIKEEMSEELAESHRRFHEELRAHCKRDDNALIKHIDGLHDSTTVRVETRARAIMGE